MIVAASPSAWTPTPPEPQSGHHDMLKLVNRPELYRLRSGDWRAIFRIRDGKVVVLRVQHRREAYR